MAVAPVSGREPEVLAEDIARSFGEINALRGVSLRIPEGAIHGLLGPNGAGKTTLFRILTGQIKPDRGRVVVAGVDVVGNAPALRRMIGVLFDTQNLYPRLSVRENLVLFAALYGVSHQRVDDLIRRFDLASRARSRVETLSHGMRQKVLLARAMLHDPDVLFLDEPTTGLDPNWSLSVQELISDVRKDGVTVVIATHQMETADALCDVVSIIDGGVIVASDTPSALKRRFGRHAVRMERSVNGVSVTEDLSLDDAGTAQRVGDAIAQRELRSVHSAEATLADVFRTLTGKPFEVTTE